MPSVQPPLTVLGPITSRQVSKTGTDLYTADIGLEQRVVESQPLIDLPINPVCVGFSLQRGLPQIRHHIGIAAGIHKLLPRSYSMALRQRDLPHGYTAVEHFSNVITRQIALIEIEPARHGN